MPAAHASSDLNGLESAELKKLASSPTPPPSKALAIEALALRAVEDTEGRIAALDAISAERMLRSRMGPELGWLGGAAILGSNNSALIAQLLDRMNGWSADEQRDLLRVFAGQDGLSDYLDDLKTNHSWQPAFAL